MPIILKQAEISYNDNGTYKGINAIAQRPTAQMISQVQAAGAETIAEIKQKIVNSQSAINNIENQKNTIIASIASIAEQGTDTTLTQSGVAADAKVTGDEIRDLKSAFNAKVESKYTTIYPTNWFNGDAVSSGILKANGTVEASDNNIYTDYIPVAENDLIRAYYGNSNRPLIYKTNICCYNASKNVLSAKGTNSASLGPWTVPSDVAYIRVTISKGYQDKAIITKNLEPTSYTVYFEPYYTITSDFLTTETAGEIARLGSIHGLDEGTVRGFNLVTPENSGVGAYYVSGGIKFDGTITTMGYAIVPLKKHTRYYVNCTSRYYIFTDDNDTILSHSLSGWSKLSFDSGEATKLYYTVAREYFNVGLIISEGYTGVSENMIKPEFINGINQNAMDSWFAVAMPVRHIRFTVGINEKLYIRNILALEKNMLDLHCAQTTIENDGFLVEPVTTTSYSNSYWYNVYDDNLSLVAASLQGSQNRQYIYADNVSSCSALLIGDSIIERDSGKIGQTMIDAFESRGKTLTLLGTRGSGASKNEGRSGWSTNDYVGLSARGRNEDPGQTVVNAFWNSTTEKFDFGYYMTNNNYSAVDFVVIHLGGNDLFNYDLSNARNAIKQTEDNIFEMIDSILAWNPSQKIIIQLAPTISTNTSYVNLIKQKILRATFTTFNAEMLVLTTEYSIDNVRCSNDYMILDATTDMSDHIHPNTTGLTKIGMELVSQINCWQNA